MREHYSSKRADCFAAIVTDLLRQSAIPSHLLNELPAKQFEVVPMTTNYGGTRFDTAGSFKQESTYATPGWQRAQDRQQRGETLRTSPCFTEGKSEIVGAVELGFKVGEKVFHQKFGYGNITSIEANKLTVDFDKAGEKLVIDTFVERG